MWVDIVSAAVRALSFVAAFQAAGLAIFCALFGRLSSHAAIAPLGRACAWVAIALVALHHLLEAGRMTGDMSGMFDEALQYLSLSSSIGAANGLRIVGLAWVAVSLGSKRAGARTFSLAGAVLFCAAFAVTGHTTMLAHHWISALLIWLHVVVVAFWFGALLPLWSITRRESPSQAGAAVAEFSKIAIWTVPLIAVAGVIMAVRLLPSLDVLTEPYGQLLLAKSFGFAALMGLAALNKWRLGPALGGGDPAVLTAFRRSVFAEFLLICVVLSVTAVMTALFSPE